jgi:short-subunit dehydrogenase
MTEFSRSLSIENWGTGVDVLVVTPFYVVSNLFKRKYGTIVAPMPIALVKGTFAQLGKKYVWQVHGYWFHSILGNFFKVYWNGVARNRKMMFVSRVRNDTPRNMIDCTYACRIIENDSKSDKCRPTVDKEKRLNKMAS